MKRDSLGFTLIELMIVLTIIGVLAAIAYPTYQDNIRKARRTDGHAFLLDVMARQERYYSENNLYTDDLADLGFSADGNGNYLSPDQWYAVTAAACSGNADDLNECVILTATPQNPHTDASCGNLTYNSRGAKGQSVSTATVETCW